MTHDEIKAAAQNLLDVWDQNEWEEHAGGGELADAVSALRRTLTGGRDEVLDADDGLTRPRVRGNQGVLKTLNQFTGQLQAVVTHRDSFRCG